MFNRRILSSFVALFAATLSAFAEVGTPALDWPTTVDPATGAAVTVTVSGSPAYVYADFLQGKNTITNAVRVYFTKGAGDVWEGEIPAGRAGAAKVVVTAEFEDRVTAATNSVKYEEIGVATMSLTNQRYPAINKWPQTIPSSGIIDGDWMGRNLDRENVVVQAVRLVGSPVTNTPGFSGSGAGGNLRTEKPVADGVGSVWLKAKMANTNRVEGGKLAIDRITWITGTGNRARYSIKELAEIEVPAATAFNEWHQYHLLLQSENPTVDPTDQGYYRIRNKTDAGTNTLAAAENASVDVCDIVLTPLIPDVRIYKDAADYSPGYPSVKDPVEFHVTVSNRFSYAPAGHFTPRLVWRQGENAAWREEVMTNRADRTAQGDGTYACTLTRADGLSDGPFEYFYEVGFSGYTPTFPARKNKGELLNNVVNYRFDFDEVPFLIHTNAWALITDANDTDANENVNENVNESRAPSRKPDFKDTFDKGGAPFFWYYGQSFDVATNSAAWDSDRGRWGWGHENSFDLRNLDEGWPSGKAWFPYRTESREAGLAEGVIQIPGTYRYLHFQAADGVRHFRSKYDELSVVPTDAASNHLDAAYPMQQVGDYTWQAIIHVTNAIDTAFSVTGACEYVKGGRDFLPGPFEWGEVNQEMTAINPPMDGYIARYDLWDADQATEGGVWPTNSTWAPVRTVIDYDGFLMFRCCTTNGSYQIRRAAWQDFNQWQADDNYYSRSFGIYNTQTFRSDLDHRDPTEFRHADFYDPEVFNLATTEQMVGSAYWAGILANNAWLVEDRERWDPDNDVYHNQAFRLSTKPGLEGSLETTQMTYGNGRDTLSFRMRVSSDDDRATIYKADPPSWSNATDYAIVARTTVSSMSDGHPSVSILGYYQDERNYWEARFTQWAKLTSNKKYRTGMRVQFFKVVDGVSFEVGASQRPHTQTDNQDIMPKDGAETTTLTGGNYQLTRGSASGDGWTFVLRMTASTAQVDVYEPGAGDNLPATPKWRYEFPLSGGTTGGTFGFNARDCDATIMPFAFNASDNLSLTAWKNRYDTKAAVSKSTEGSWTQGVRESYGYVKPWAPLTPATGTTPAKLHRPAPTVYWRLQTYRTGEEKANDFKAPVPGADGEDWASSWVINGENGDDNLPSDGIHSANSFGWKKIKLPIHFWDDSFLKIQALVDDGQGNPSGGMLVVDDLECNDWRGQTVEDDYYHTNKFWVATYAAIHEEGRTGRTYELSRTRKDPTTYKYFDEGGHLTNQVIRPQAVSTPFLADGLGDILFKYRAEGAPVKFVIEAVYENGSSTNLGAVITANPNGSWETAYRACLQRGVSGRLRIRTCDAEEYDDGTDPYGTLYVDELRATDYPNTGDSSWEVYNALVSTFKTNPELKFDGSSSLAANYRSLVLNDAPDKDTEGGKSWDENIPYVQTPAIETGVGEVSFWYRASPDNKGRPARLVLAVANAATTPDEEWVPLTAEDLNTNAVENLFLSAEQEALGAITNIVDDLWRYFSAEFFKQDYRLLRIYSVSGDNVTNRVMLDNVLITEPVRASIDVGKVEFDPGVPLCTQDTGVRVRLVNPRMNPHDIEVFLDWYVADPNAELETFPIRNVTIDSYEKDIPHHTNIIINGVSTEVSWISHETIVTTNETDEITRLPESMTNDATRKWGYEAWKDRPTGTLTFTNAPNDAYTFYSTGTIPTDRYPPDTVFQYCVRVLYEGRFKAPVYSETQGQVKNGFWFSNPSWYEPIDLNEAFGTEEQPVAHFWNLTVPTNSVFINEILPDMFDNRWIVGGPEDVEALRRQFVELMGPEGGDIADWSLQHCGFNSAGLLDPTIIVYTNIMAYGAVFEAANNATTNKGWGFYILGNSGVANRNQELFEDELLVHDATQLLDVEGALTLRRSMGAYADRVAWTTADNTETWTRLGYTYAGFRRMAQNAAFALQGDAENESGKLNWSLTASFTPGGYNDAEEISLWWLDGTEPDRPDPPEISQPVFKGFTMNEDAGTVLLRFSFASVNGVAVAADDFSWYVETSDSLTFELSSLIEITTPITAPAEPDPPTTVEVTVPISAGGSRFYRIKAFPKGE